MPSTTSPAYAPLPTGASLSTAPVGTGAPGTTGGTVPCAVGAGAGTADSTGRGGMTCVPASGTAGAALDPTLGAAVAGSTTSRTAAAVEVARRGARMWVSLPDGPGACRRWADALHCEPRALHGRQTITDRARTRAAVPAPRLPCRRESTTINLGAE